MTRGSFFEYPSSLLPMLFSSLLGGHAKHGNIEHISFLCINETCLHGSDLLGNQMALDGIGMNAIVKIAIHV